MLGVLIYGLWSSVLNVKKRSGECSVHRCFLFFDDTATTEIYTLSLHDALPIFDAIALQGRLAGVLELDRSRVCPVDQDRKSTRLNSSHLGISYAVFCLKKK